ncbi:histamine H2 receptor-like [Asterias amurensis]|uniref:histamine H2 receptor-like n=1 Tax=Asterias amurensis TaxID=7602 RepID=UPI003AB416D1
MSSVNNINSTSTDYDGLSPVLIALRTCFIAIIALLIISGNILSIAVTRRVTNLADSTKVLMTSLAVSDLMIGIFTSLSVVASALDSWPFGGVGCEVVVIYTHLCFGMSVLSITCLNIERFLAVTRPYKFPVWCSRFRVKLLVLVLAFLGLCFSLATKIASESYAEFNHVLQACEYVNAPTYPEVLTLLFGDIFPTILMSCIYYRLIKISRQHEQRLNQNGNNEANNNHDNKALKTFLVVTSTYAVCYTPFLTVKVVKSLPGMSIPGWLQFITVWLLISNSMFNVIIYCLFNKLFRQKAKKILSERFPSCNRSIGPIEITP